MVRSDTDVVSRFNAQRRALAIKTEGKISAKIDGEVSVDESKAFLDVLTELFDTREVLSHKQTCALVRYGLSGLGKRRTVLDRLGRAGFLKFSKSEKDKRVVEVRLTSRSKSLVKTYYRKLTELLREACGELS